MAASYRDIATSFTTAGTQTPTATVPSGAVNGDTIYAWLNYADNTLTCTIPGGWTQHVNTTAGSSRIVICSKTKTGSDTNCVFTLSASGTGTYAKAEFGCMAVAAQSSVTFGTPFVRSGSTTQNVAPAVSPAASDALLLMFSFEKASSQTSITGDSLMTQRVSHFTGGGGGCSQWVGTQALSASGSTGSRTVSYGVGSTAGYAVLAYVDSAATPPTCSAGADISGATVGAEVTITGTDSDGDGTVVARQWTCVGAPPGVTTGSVSITNATTASMKFTPTTTGVYTFRYVVTDNGGLQSTPDDVKVFVPSLTVRLISEVSNTTFTNVGGAADIPAALRDSLNATYAESATTGTSVWKGRLAPIVPPDTFRFDIGSLLSAAGSPVAYTVKLYEGATERKSWSPSTPTTTVSTTQLTLSGGEIATITNWDELDLEFTWQAT